MRSTTFVAGPGAEAPAAANLFPDVQRNGLGCKHAGPVGQGGCTARAYTGQRHADCHNHKKLLQAPAHLLSEPQPGPARDPNTPSLWGSGLVARPARGHFATSIAPIWPAFPNCCAASPGCGASIACAHAIRIDGCLPRLEVQKPSSDRYSPALMQVCEIKVVSALEGTSPGDRGIPLRLGWQPQLAATAGGANLQRQSLLHADVDFLMSFLHRR